MPTAPNTANVNTPSLAYQDMEQARKLPRTLIGGTKAMRAAAREYLPQEPAESAQNYENRLSRSVLFNVYAQAMGDLTGKVFSKPVHPKDDVPEDIKSWLEDIDLAGNDLNTFAKKVFEDAFHGVSYVLVDYPRVATGGTLKEEREAGARPYCVHVPCQNLIGWKSARINGVETLTQVRLREMSVEADGEWGEKTVCRVRVLDLKADAGGVPRCYFTVWEKTKGAQGQEDWQPNKDLSGVMSIGFIPIVAVYTKRTDFMAGTPPLADLADLNCLHWQKWSDANQIEHVASVPILFFTGFTPTEGGKPAVTEIAASKMLTDTNSEANLRYVEHSGAAISSNRESLKDLEDRMAKAALDPMVTRPGNVTATATSVDTAKASCPLQAWALGLQDSLELVLQFMGAWTGKKPEECGGINVNSDFGLSATGMTLDELTQAYQAGLLSRETIWDEMKRSGQLPDEFQAEDEKDRLMTEARDGTIQSAATRFLAPNQPPAPASGRQQGQGESA